MLTSSLIALAASIATVSAKYNGFNYGSTFNTGAAKQEADFLAEFKTAQGLVGTDGAFTSARLYTMVQAGTANSPISAIPAAIASKTSLLLGLWASAGQANINNEIAALNSAISQYGTAFTSLIAGISVGSEDLYRNSPTGIINMSGIGANPADLVSYIKQVRAAIAGTSAASAPVGHVDTWTAWVNGSNADVIANCDFLGMDAYPYFQNTQANSIENNHDLFFEAYNNTLAVSTGKSVWVTETGFPVSGPTEGQAVPSIANAKTYWDGTACELFGSVNTWYYTLQDAAPTTPSPSFGLVGSTLTTTPLFDLTCPAKAVASSSTSSTASATKSVIVSSSVASSVPAKDTTTSVPAKVSTTSVPAKDSTTSVPAKDSTTSVPAKDSTTSVATTTSVPAKDSTTSAPAKISTTSAPAKDSTTIIQPTETGDVTITITSTVYGTASVCSAALDTTVTVKSTAYVTTTCASCSTSSAPVAPVSSSKASSSAPASSSTSVVVVSSAKSTSSTKATSSAPATSVVSSTAASSKTSSAPATSSTACPTDLNGTYQYPHLIVPVNSASPNTAYGTQYFPVINPTVSTIFNFDIPASYAGQTCSLVFLFPEKKDLETADYTYTAAGGIAATQLASVATNATTYANQPKAAAQLTSIPALTAGHGYVVASGPCAAGQAVSYELSSTNGLNLTYFEDWNPSPLGLFVRVC